MPKKVCLSIDMEPDCPPFLNTFRGIEEGTDPFLKLLDQENIKATFFTTGQVARKYPKTISAIVEQGHELACHGDSHKPFPYMNREEAEREITESSKTLREFADVVSFRAPNLMFPDEYLDLLEKAEYKIDSSEAKYKPAYYKPSPKTTLQRIPASVTSSVLRLPDWIRFPYLRVLSDPVVLFVHPWEFVDLRKEHLRLDCRFKTGQTALECLFTVIKYFKSRGSDFFPIRELAGANRISR